MYGKRLAALILALLLAPALPACGGERTEKTVVLMQQTPAPAVTAQGSQTVAEAPETLAPDWYGWWKMDHCSGDWSKMYGYYWDCCAQMAEEDGAIRLLLWDEDMPKENCLAAACLTERDGKLRCADGSFLDRPLTADDWLITRGADKCGACWTIEGEYKALGKGGFHYAIYLRPWGSRWPGTADEQPYFYESWYLPLIETGAPMPDIIGKKEENNA